MDNIGKRAAEAILQRVGGHRSMDAELDRLKLTRQGFYQWETGKHTPSGKMLQKLALAGYDVHWILTGERKNNE